jgi:hypothetical protein
VTVISTDNPPVEEVLRILNAEMRKGATRPIAAGGLTVLETKYRSAFEKRLSEKGTWAREGENVKNAARQVGIIACAIASLENKSEVTREMVKVATVIAEEHCAIGYEEGRWCRSDDV